MLMVWGTRLYGRVDMVPGLFHVETRFGHFNYFPLIPLESYVVISKSGDQFNGVRIPLSFRSVGYTWLRALTLLFGLGGLCVALVRVPSDPQGVIPVFIVSGASLACSLVFLFAQGVTHATYDRAREIATLIGLPRHGLEYIDEVYGRSIQVDPESRLGDGFDQYGSGA